MTSTLAAIFTTCLQMSVHNHVVSLVVNSRGYSRRWNIFHLHDCSQLNREQLRIVGNTKCASSHYRRNYWAHQLTTLHNYTGTFRENKVLFHNTFPPNTQTRIKWRRNYFGGFGDRVLGVGFWRLKWSFGARDLWVAGRVLIIGFFWAIFLGGGGRSVVFLNSNW